jgi:hypothetical protein
LQILQRPAPADAKKGRKIATLAVDAAAGEAQGHAARPGARTRRSAADPLALSDRLHAVGRLVDAGLLATLQIDMGDDTAAVAEVLGRAKAEIEELAEEVGRLQRPAA